MAHYLGTGSSIQQSCNTLGYLDAATLDYGYSQPVPANEVPPLPAAPSSTTNSAAPIEQWISGCAAGYLS